MTDERIKRPAYQWNVVDARGDEIYMLMSYEQRGIFRELLDQQWIEGSIPAKPEHLAGLLKLSPARFAKVWPLIASKFRAQEPDRLVNDRMEAYRRELDAWCAKQAENGRKGGRPKTHGLFLGNPRVSQTEPKKSSTSTSTSTTQNKNKNDGAAPSATPSPTVLEFPTIGINAHTWALTEAQIAEWQVAYPSTDILAEARKALAWVRAEPGRRKTAGGMTRFLVGWLNRAVDRGGSSTSHVRPSSRHQKWHSDGKGEIADV